MESSGRKPANQSSRSVRDGAVAAAIGVALSIALESGKPVRSLPAPTTDAPWVQSARVHMSTVRTGWQREEGWGVPAGWNAVYGRWEYPRK